MIFHAWKEFYRDKAMMKYPAACYVYASMLDIDGIFEQPQAVVATELAHELCVEKETILKAMNVLVMRGYLIEHGRRPGNIRTFTIALERGEEHRLTAALEESASDERRAEWRVRFLTLQRLCSMRRRARKIGAAMGPRDEYRAFIKWARSEPSIDCQWCGHPTTPASRHIDHIIPLARGGADSADNLCVACPTCNLRKGSKLPHEFQAEATA